MQTQLAGSGERGQPRANFLRCLQAATHLPKEVCTQKQSLSLERLETSTAWGGGGGVKHVKASTGERRQPRVSLCEVITQQPTGLQKRASQCANQRCSGS
eukprot:scaffold153874_cov18-Tisochrysis_lutea.AAC.2